MRFLLGVIAGVLLTVGIAFVSDSTVTAEVTSDTNRQIVNWEVAKQRLTISRLWFAMDGSGSNMRLTSSHSWVPASRAKRRGLWTQPRCSLSL